MKRKQQEQKQNQDEEEQKHQAKLVEMKVDPNVFLMFTSGSKDVSPGLGAQEKLKLSKDSTVKVMQLLGMDNWRRTLSNFSPHPVTVDGKVFANVEAGLQYGKFKYNNMGDDARVQALLRTDLSGLEARKMRKAIKLTPDQLRTWNKAKRGYIQALLRDKFTRHADARSVLMATGNATLLHHPMRAPRHGWNVKYGVFIDHTQWSLMQVRSELASGLDISLE